MIEDKQIYTTARSEEIKRQLKEYWSWIKEQKKNLDKRRVKSSNGKSVSPSPKKESVEKRQNVMIDAWEIQPNPSSIKESKKQKSLFVDAERRQKIFTFLTYALFVFILGFIILSIYLVNFVR